MAPTRPKGKKAKKQKPHPGILIHDAAAKLEEGQVELAAAAAKRALEATGDGGDFELAALDLLGQIHVELGDPASARGFFARAAALDPDGDVDERVGGGADKFLWLAQLSDEGGRDSVAWFERGADALRRQVRALADGKGSAQQGGALQEKRRKLAGTLCAVTEVYMTDLSWEADAEQRCEALVTEATITAPEVPETWQTVASVRISQQRLDEAKAALVRSLELWKDLPPESDDVPDFAARISLSRLLLEVEMREEAMEVLERLMAEDDSSVEAWYLGGWALYLTGEKQKGNAKQNGHGGEEKEEAWTSSRQWLKRCLKLYDEQEYEDERLAEHAKELLSLLVAEVGDASEEEDADEWEDADNSDESGDDDDDDDMKVDGGDV